MTPSRRAFVAASAGMMASTQVAADTRPPTKRKARIAISFDLEMSRNFPTWETTHWDYEKGNLNEDTKRYSVEAARRVRRHGGVIHFFCVGRVLEQANVDWLRQIVQTGHPIGNHTYDHVNLTARIMEDVQFRFRRCPWLVEGKTPFEVIRENIALTTEAMRTRLGIRPAGFRTPGGFPLGLRDFPETRRMLSELGFSWISSMYPSHPVPVNQEPDAATVQAVVESQARAQPFSYADGMVEIPMSPISDIGAFRTGRWRLETFLDVLRRSLTWVIENHAVFDFLAHPSCLHVVDPEFRAVELICDLVRRNANRAEIVNLDTIANSLRR